MLRTSGEQVSYGGGALNLGEGGAAGVCTGGGIIIWGKEGRGRVCVYRGGEGGIDSSEVPLINIVIIYM